jgi:hypothetical protein
MRNVNPFTFGALALDEGFADREDELRALVGDLVSGQDVVVIAPRRYGKTSLALRAAGAAAAQGVLVAYCDLMRTPTKTRFAAALAKTIYDELASPLGEALERVAGLFRGLRVRPTVEVDVDGDLRFVFEPVRRSTDIDATIERLLELPAEIAAERGRRVCIVLDEFQEVLTLDDTLPNVMRAVFQTQPEVAHVYLGSRRHVLQQIFEDRNAPFWRSAKQVELARLPAEHVAPFVNERFASTERAIEDDALARLLELTDGHPYATQELAYFTWELVPHGHAAQGADIERALAQVLRSEHNNLARLWEDATPNERLLLLALAAEPGGVYGEAYRRRHGLPAAASVQRAVASLDRAGVIGRVPTGGYAIAEPFLVEWLQREDRWLR